MRQETKMVIREYGESLLIAFILAMIIRAFVVQAFKIPTGSMIPTLIEGDRILVNKFIYRFHEPERGDVIVFKYPENPKIAFIKRLIALENEKIMIHNGRIFIDAKEITDPAISSRFYYNRGPYGDVNQEITVLEKSLYALGDNSANSRDSRYWGYVPRKNLIGKAILIYWPPYRMRLIK
ncbi:MAG: signal peptidase I [Candidatus Omnitrophica bacterium]|nr:signal peptidase I [Candidatus Omnitrophota bacterium]MBU4478149.1 signal peptidase I [Candidatus Omnitrophota bacterium]MCG2704054.1 signal peptidase I [Candidatus Omnitrophota bacterium]